MVKINLSTYNIQLLNNKKPVILDKINYSSLIPDEIPKSIIPILSNFLIKGKEKDFQKMNKTISIKKIFII